MKTISTASVGMLLLFAGPPCFGSENHQIHHETEVYNHALPEPTQGPETLSLHDTHEGYHGNLQTGYFLSLSCLLLIAAVSISVGNQIIKKKLRPDSQIP